MNYSLAVPIFISVLFLSAPCFADAGHGHGPKYGGVAREVGNLTYELVVKPNAMILYVSDHGKPVSNRGAKADATVYASNEKTAMTLEPAGENKLATNGSFKTGVGVRVAVTVALAGQKETRLTFNLK